MSSFAAEWNGQGLCGLVSAIYACSCCLWAPLPDTLDFADAAPLMWAGVSVFSAAPRGFSSRVIKWR